MFVFFKKVLIKQRWWWAMMTMRTWRSFWRPKRILSPYHHDQSVFRPLVRSATDLCFSGYPRGSNLNKNRLILTIPTAYTCSSICSVTKHTLCLFRHIFFVLFLDFDTCFRRFFGPLALELGFIHKIALAPCSYRFLKHRCWSYYCY